MNRRNLLLAGPALLMAKPFSHPVGLNLFTVRGPLGTAPAATYAALGQIGIEVLEVRPAQLNQHASMMKDAGLKPVHMFIESAIVTGAWEEWGEYSKGMMARLKLPAPPANAPRASLEDMIALAVKHGVKRIGTSMLLAGERPKAIEAINRAAETCARGGVELYYHNHAFEFDGAAGGRYIDRLKRELDPKVRLELDIFWASITGNSPAQLLSDWKGRVKSIHLKDMAPGAARPQVETDVKPESFRELGKGSLDLKGILKAAEQAGVEYYLIELDHSPGDAVESVRNCYQYLKSVSY